MRLLRRIFYLLNRRRADRDLADEIAAHREMLPEDRHTSFGNALRLREESQDAWGFAWLDQLRQDLAYGARTLWRAKGFTFAAIGVLALGIGANLAEFHIFDVVLFHRLNIRDSQTLLRLTRQFRGRAQFQFPIAATSFYRDHATLLDYVVTENTGVPLGSDDGSALRSGFVSPNYFASLGIRPSYGRLLNSTDGDPGAPPVAALGYVYWQTRFGSDPSVVGSTIRLNGRPAQVVGVLPYDFDGLAPHRTAVWLPESTGPYLVAGSPPLNDFGQGDSEMFGKPKPGVSVEAAEAQLLALTNELRAQQPRYVQPDERIRAERVQYIPPLSQIQPAVLMIALLVLLVLLSACANLGNVLLARGLAREREIGIRMAVGAGRWRVIRQLMTENFLLAALGSAAGLAVGFVAAKWLIYAMDAPPDIHIGMDWQIVLSGAVLAGVSALGFGLAPAMHAVRRGTKATRARQVLIGVQVAIGCVLLILAATMTRGVQRNASIDVPFDYTHMVLVDPHRYSNTAAPQRLDELAARVEQLPGVRAVTAATIPPLWSRRRFGYLSGAPPIYLNSVAPSYFQVMNLPMLRGRTFVPGEQNAFIVSESTARAVWPTEDPIGKNLDLGRIGQGRVVGVVKDSSANLFADPNSVEAYLPLSDSNPVGAVLIVHAGGDPGSLVKDIGSSVGAPGETITSETMLTQVNVRMDNMRKNLTVIGSLGATATFLAALGIFGLVAFAVAQRTREIGLRVALGARPTDILRTLVAQYIMPIGLGTAAGVAFAMAGARVLLSQFYGLVSLDLVNYFAGLGVFGLVALLATLIPARRALRIDPASALRWE